jgi:phosphatidate cytidylyltransferase
MKTRLLFGFLLGPLFLFFTIQSTPWLLFALLVVHLAAQSEFCSIVEGLSLRVRLSHLLVSSLVLLALSLGLLGRADPSYGLLLVALMVIAYAALAALDYERGLEQRRFILLLRSILFISLPFACIAACIAAPLAVPAYLLLLGASWGADTGAIFAGKLLGRTPLAPRLSPKKTVEGVVGGMLAAGLVCALGGAVAARLAGAAGLDWARMGLLLPLGAGLSLAGLFGDLAFSMFKREAQIKDYSAVIPGHGGILDRFDSMLFVAPLLYLLLQTQLL